jgi:hypothetical protein
MVEFMSSTADFYGWFSSYDRDLVESLFKDQVTNVISIDFKVIAKVAGSTIAGVGANESDLVTGQFSIKFVATELAATCEDHYFFWTDLTYDDADRMINTLVIPEYGTSDPVTPSVIKGFRLEYETECPLVITAEVKVWGWEWQEIVNDDNFAVSLDKDNDISVTV